MWKEPRQKNQVVPFLLLIKSHGVVNDPLKRMSCLHQTPLSEVTLNNHFIVVGIRNI